MVRALRREHFKVLFSFATSSLPYYNYLRANDHRLSRTPQLYSLYVTDSLPTYDHTWSILDDSRLMGGAQKVHCYFRESPPRPLQTEDRYRSGLPVNKVRHQPPHTQLPQRLHTMKSHHTVQAISMSHEQNMHHHLIYFATTMFNTNETRSGCSLLISIQMISCF
jgi:hypothetical protein